MSNDQNVKIFVDAANLILKSEELLEEFKNPSDKGAFSQVQGNLETLKGYSDRLSFSRASELITLGIELCQKSDAVSEVARLLTIHILLSQLLRKLELLFRQKQSSTDELLGRLREACSQINEKMKEEGAKDD